jgi:O-antigen/teichoic acid export membrane protein
MPVVQIALGEAEVSAMPADVVTAAGLPLAGKPSRFITNSVFGTVAGLGSALTNFCATVIVAHLLGLAATGAVAYAMWIVTLVATFGDFGVNASLSRYLPELLAGGDRQQATSLTGFLLRPTVLGSIAAFVGFGLYGAWVWRAGPQFRADAILWVLIGIACGLQVLSAFTIGYLRGVQRFDRIALMGLISLALQLGGVAGGSVLFGVPGALAGYCAGSLLPAALIGFIGRPTPRLDDAIRSRVVRYAFYAWAAALTSSFVWSRIEVFFLQRSAGTAAVGLFTAALTLSNLAGQGPILLTAGLLPYFAGRFGRGALAEVNDAFASATRLLAFVVLPASLGLMAILPVVLPLIYGRAFAAAVAPAVVLAGAAAVGATASVGSNLIYAMDRSDFVFANGIAAALAAIVAGLTVIPAYGVIGAAWARTAIQLSSVAFGFWFIVRRLRCPIPFNELTRLLIAALLCAGAARGCLSLLPPLPALAAAVPAGGIVYLAAVRLLRPLPPRDIDRLRALTGILPPPLRRPADLALSLIAGSTSAAADRSGPAGRPWASGLGARLSRRSRANGRA